MSAAGVTFVLHRKSGSCTRCQRHRISPKRGWVIEPRVAAARLPWVPNSSTQPTPRGLRFCERAMELVEQSNLTRDAAIVVTMTSRVSRNPFGVECLPFPGTQGSRGTATLGFTTQPRWGCVASTTSRLKVANDGNLRRFVMAKMCKPSRQTILSTRQVDPLLQNVQSMRSHHSRTPGTKEL